LWTLVAAIVLTVAVPSVCEAADPVRRLFLDDHHIQSMTGLSRVYHQPVKDPAPVIVPDKPWETNGWVRQTGWYPYGSHAQVWSPPVWNPELSKRQLWYQGGKEGLPLYAESTDGINWVKPNLGLYTRGGSKNNNITLLPTAPFEYCFAAPLCAPSRAMCMFGRYGFRTGVTDNGLGAAATPESEVCIAKVLKQAGYATAVAGKWSDLEYLVTQEDAAKWGFDEFMIWGERWEENGE
jgi:hypothetical protein